MNLRTLPNPALAAVLSDLRDANASYVGALKRIAETATATAEWATNSPYVDDLSDSLLAERGRLAGQRLALIRAVLAIGGTNQQVTIALGRDTDAFYDLYDTLRAN